MDGANLSLSMYKACLGCIRSLVVRRWRFVLDEQKREEENGSKRKGWEVDGGERGRGVLD